MNKFIKLFSQLLDFIPYYVATFAFFGIASTSKLSKTSSQTIRKRKEGAAILLVAVHCKATHYLQRNR